MQFPVCSQFPQCSFLGDQEMKRHTASLWKSCLEGMRNEFRKASWNLIMHEKYTKGRKEPIRQQLRRLQLQCILIKSKKYQPTNRRQASYLQKKREVEIRKLCKSDIMKAKNRKGKMKLYFALSSVYVQIPSIFHESILMAFLEALLFSTVIKLRCFLHNQKTNLNNPPNRKYK